MIGVESSAYGNERTEDDGGFDCQVLYLDTLVPCDHLLGKHVANYISILMEDEDAYKRQFSRVIKLGLTSDELEGMYKNAHAAIRADPTRQAKPAKQLTKNRSNARRLERDVGWNKVCEILIAILHYLTRKG